MTRKEKRKLCWNCEGNVARTETNCPYCGVYLHPNEEEEDDDTLDIEPPYSPEETPEEEFSVPYGKEQTSNEPVEAAPSATKHEIRSVLLPISFMLCGSMLLLFGVMLFLFSHHGTLTLHWDASYWRLYLLIALPLLYFGWHTLDPSPDKLVERVAEKP